MPVVIAIRAVRDQNIGNRPNRWTCGGSTQVIIVGVGVWILKSGRRQVVWDLHCNLTAVSQKQCQFGEKKRMNRLEQSAHLEWSTMTLIFNSVGCSQSARFCSLSPRVSNLQPGSDPGEILSLREKKRSL
eukprot:139223-Rhodomonas_salina.2